MTRGLGEGFMTMFECDTPYREGYFMSQDQADAVLGRLFRERSEAQKHLILLRAEARKLGELFTGLGAIVQSDKVWNISLESYQPFLSKETYEKITKLKTGIREDEQNLARLNDEAKKFGT
ncbi:MAG: hypothetical protein DMG39_30705 [Acidobacteria bacterium]|nr:MAG: hypothetical protein DMG39_30705 [Acidobacteriota bacterium]